MIERMAAMSPRRIPPCWAKGRALSMNSETTCLTAGLRLGSLMAARTESPLVATLVSRIFWTRILSASSSPLNSALALSRRNAAWSGL